MSRNSGRRLGTESQHCSSSWHKPGDHALDTGGLWPFASARGKFSGRQSEKGLRIARSSHSTVAKEKMSALGQYGVELATWCSRDACVLGSIKL